MIPSFSSHRKPLCMQSMSSNGHYFDQLWTKNVKNDYLLGVKVSRQDNNDDDHHHHYDHDDDYDDDDVFSAGHPM